MYKCLKKMNFGNNYIGFIKTLYNDICTHVISCGFLSEGFNRTRGIRQGCPISAYLFVLIVEVMACTIRQNPRILGIKVGNKTCKIS
jgi:hypothetical protein